MDRTSFANDCVNVFYSDDGENISEYIRDKLADEKYKIDVILYNVSFGTTPKFRKCVQVLILTPEVYHRIQQNKMSRIFQLLEDSVNRILLYHPSVNAEQEANRRTLHDSIQNISSWKIVPLGNTNHDFKKALLEIIRVVDQPDILPVLKQFTLAPSAIWNTEDEVHIILRKRVSAEEVEVRVLDSASALERKIENLRQVNAKTFVFKPIGFAHGMKKVEVSINGETAGRNSLEIKPKLDMLNKLLCDVVNPIELMCQTLKIEAGRETLDLELNDIFTNGGSNPMSEFAEANFEYSTEKQKQSELPTLLHFGAKYGFYHLCSTLLTYPGGKAALRIKNKDGKTPYKLAVYCGHTDLADNVLITNDPSALEGTVTLLEDNYMHMDGARRTDRKSLTKTQQRVSFDSSEIENRTNDVDAVTMRRRFYSETQQRSSGDDDFRPRLGPRPVLQMDQISVQDDNEVEDHYMHMNNTKLTYRVKPDLPPRQRSTENVNQNVKPMQGDVNIRRNESEPQALSEERRDSNADSGMFTLTKDDEDDVFLPQNTNRSASISKLTKRMTIMWDDDEIRLPHRTTSGAYGADEFESNTKL